MSSPQRRGSLTAATVILASALGHAQTPIINASPPVVPLFDDGETVIQLTSTPKTGGVGGGGHQFEWIIPGATFVDGTDATSAAPRITIAGDAPVPIELFVTIPGQSEPSKGWHEVGVHHGSAVAYGTPRVWHTFELRFSGPDATVLDDAPNPFLDYRVDVTFRRPDGSELVVPGFYDGDGKGGFVGDVWKARLTPDVEGLWAYEASFREGPQVAVDEDPLAGEGAGFDGAAGFVFVEPADPDAPGFLRRGRLEYVGEHYLRFRDGSSFVKSGTNSPENLLGFSGFTDVVDQGGQGIVHDYAPHLADVTPADPVLPGPAPATSRALFGALNYLAERGVNACYFLPLNLGGDGQETTPFVGYSGSSFDDTHYHVTRLNEWERVFQHAQERGILLQFVLGETESANKNWLDGGDLGTERKLFYRELVARFAHHLALKWNLSEESPFQPAELRDMAEWLRALDPYDHPISFHNPVGVTWLFGSTIGDPSFEATSFQYKMDDAGWLVETWRANSANAGRPWVLDMDEHSPPEAGAGPDNADDLRRRVTYDVYFSGGHLEWYLGQYPLPIGGDTTIEDFRTRETLWDQTTIARQIVESLPFTQMEPSDELLSNEAPGYGGGEVFALAGEVYAVYLPSAIETGRLDLGSGAIGYDGVWIDPRTGAETPAAGAFTGPGDVELGSPPHSPDQDWVLVLRRQPLTASEAVLSAALGGDPELRARRRTGAGGRAVPGPRLRFGHRARNAPRTGRPAPAELRLLHPLRPVQPEHARPVRLAGDVRRRGASDRRVPGRAGELPDARRSDAAPRLARAGADADRDQQRPARHHRAVVVGDTEPATDHHAAW